MVKQEKYGILPITAANHMPTGCLKGLFCKRSKTKRP